MRVVTVHCRAAPEPGPRTLACCRPPRYLVTSDACVGFQHRQPLCRSAFKRGLFISITSGTCSGAPSWTTLVDQQEGSCQESLWSMSVFTLLGAAHGQKDCRGYMELEISELGVILQISIQPHHCVQQKTSSERPGEFTQPHTVSGSIIPSHLQIWRNTQFPCDHLVLNLERHFTSAYLDHL